MNLEFTYGKVKTLNDVYYVPKIRKNLVFGDLNKFGFKSIFESDKFVLTKRDTFVGKCYLYEKMFKLNLINKVVNSSYMLVSFSLWHNRLSHIKTRRMYDMVVLNLVHKFANDLVDKCRICMQTKIT